MGFMDKARKMAEQAQEKIEAKQKQWNQTEEQEDVPGAGGVQFDDQGQPVPNETTAAQADAGIPVGESMQAEPGTIPSGASHSEGETGRAHDPVEGERPEGVDHPGEGQPPAGRVEQSGAAGNADENRSSPVEPDDVHTSPDVKKQ